MLLLALHFLLGLYHYTNIILLTSISFNPVLLAIYYYYHYIITSIISLLALYYKLPLNFNPVLLALYYF